MSLFEKIRAKPLDADRLNSTTRIDLEDSTVYMLPKLAKKKPPVFCIPDTGHLTLPTQQLELAAFMRDLNDLATRTSYDVTVISQARKLFLMEFSMRSARAYEILRKVHCVEYSALPPGTRELCFALTNFILSGERTPHPDDPIEDITDVDARHVVRLK